MIKYRFIKFEQGHKFYAESPRGAIAGTNRARALLFTDDAWREWGEAGGWEKEELSEDRVMPAAKPGAAGQPGLPGFEL